ncbi:MAG: coiled-coil protein [Thermoplasmatota archaeon]
MIGLRDEREKAGMSSDTEQFIKELEAKRDKLNVKADEHRHRRDRLNEETKRFAERRDVLNDQVKKLLREASEHKERRNALNEQVRAAKALREELNKRANEAAERLSALRRERMPRDGNQLGKLKKELKALEFRQMTTVLTPEKEKELIAALSRLQAMIKEKERAFEQNEEVRGAVMEANKTREEAEAQHTLVGRLADEAQKEHDAMVKLYEQSDALRKEADMVQEQFVRSKTAADDEHREHVNLIRQVHDFDKVIAGLRRREKKARKIKSESVAKKQAQEILERFRRGEKLSTEDLMALQTKGH